MRSLSEIKLTLPDTPNRRSPLLDDIQIQGASGILVNITGGEKMGILEINEAMSYIYNEVGEENLLEDEGKTKEELNAQSIIAEKLAAFKPPLSYFLN